MAVHLGSLTLVPGLDIAGKFAGIWLPHTMFALPLAIYLLHNFIASLPRDLMEAANVDGASHFTVFRRIVLPLSIPAIASFTIFQFLWVWNDLLVALAFSGGTEGSIPSMTNWQDLAGTWGSTLGVPHRRRIHHNLGSSGRLLLAPALLRTRTCLQVL